MYDFVRFSYDFESIHANRFNKNALHTMAMLKGGVTTPCQFMQSPVVVNASVHHRFNQPIRSPHDASSANCTAFLGGSVSGLLRCVKTWYIHTNQGPTPTPRF